MHKSKFKIYKIMLIIVKTTCTTKSDNIDNNNITESSYNVTIYGNNNKGYNNNKDYIWDNDNTIRNRNNNSTTGTRATQGTKTTIK